MLRYENHQVENRDSLDSLYPTLKVYCSHPLLREGTEGDLKFIDALSYRIRVVHLFYQISINLIPTGIGRKTLFSFLLWIHADFSRVKAGV